MAGGRPTKLTEELIEQVAEKIRRGNHPETSAVASGISRATYYEWKRRGEAGEDPYAEFWTRVARACAEAEVQLVDRAQHGDPVGVGYGESKSALEILKLRFPKRWSPQVKVEVADQLNRYLDVAQSVLDEESFKRLLTALADESHSDEEMPRV